MRFLIAKPASKNRVKPNEQWLACQFLDVLQRAVSVMRLQLGGQVNSNDVNCIFFMHGASDIGWLLYMFHSEALQ